MSMDTKKELYAFGGAKLYGNLYRDGKLYTENRLRCLTMIGNACNRGCHSHGLYDMTHNVGYIQIGTSHDTSEFACDSIRYWWNTYGKGLYPLADSICCYVMVAAAIAHVTTSRRTYRRWSTS